MTVLLLASRMLGAGGESHKTRTVPYGKDQIDFMSYARRRKKNGPERPDRPENLSFPAGFVCFSKKTPGGMNAFGEKPLRPKKN
ncbi:MAG: hypothetical protein ACOY4F_02655 [Thermodesulfobacteriota bacterium]